MLEILAGSRSDFAKLQNQSISINMVGYWGGILAPGSATLCELGPRKKRLVSAPIVTFRHITGEIHQNEKITVGEGLSGTLMLAIAPLEVWYELVSEIDT